MKTLFVISLLFCTHLLRAQDVATFMRYESEKKDYGIAFALSILPGGGFYYVSQPGKGIAFGLGEVATLAWGLSTKGNMTGNQAVWMPWALLLGQKVLEFVFVGNAVADHNAALKTSLGLTAHYEPHRGAVVSLSIHL